MRITVFGASGKVGRLVVMQALRRGHEVVAFVHSHDPFVPHAKLRIVKGDIQDKPAVVAALRSSEAVVSALGSWHTKDKNILSSAMRQIIPAMEAQNIKRIVSLTGAGALDQTDVPSIGQKLAHLMMDAVAGKVLRDGEDHIRQLRASTLDWTVVRSPIMTNVANGPYHLSNKLPPLYDTVSRHAVATCLLDQLSTLKYLHQSPVIYRR